MTYQILKTLPPSILPFQRFGVGTPLVLVHGYLGGSRQWDTLLPLLSQHFEVVTLDLAGYGRAHHMAAPTQLADHARDVLATLAHMGVDRFHLLGHSMGGMVVQEMTRQAPDRVLKLVLYATGPLGCIPGRFETMARSRERLTEDGVQQTARRICATWLRDQEASAAFEALADLASQASEQAAIAGLSAMESWDGRAHLSHITQATLVIWGEKDRSYDWSQIEMLWRSIPAASLAVLPACAHAVHLESRALFCTLLTEFLAQDPTSGTEGE
jgi:pimeloyl-ACP methyl ester carboxylesterase